jgi:ATP-binding cassette subfamily F protein uup
MALLVSSQSLAKSFGAERLFENISFTISDGERIGLIGPNGSGKSTLLKILVGELSPDEGIVSGRKMLRAGYVPQRDQVPEEATPRSYLESVPLPPGAAEDERTGRVSVVLGKAGFPDPDASVGSLSGGWRKRLAIAAAILSEPELMLLDEPTNHLDLEGILWLEKLLIAAPFATLMVTHDRYFLERFATRILEIDRSYPDGLFAVAGNYSEFLVKREVFFHAQARRKDALENVVKREIEWLRRGAKARTSKSKARIDNAGRLMEELDDVSSRRTERLGAIDFTATGRRTKRLIEAEAVSKTLGGRPLFKKLSFVLSPGTRLGLIGQNGSGKTTLLKLLAGQLTPDAGEIRRADGVKVVYFDQHRERLDPTLSLKRALAPHGDGVIFQGRPVHVVGWAVRFLFRADQLELPVGRLSGGEQARVLIARMMLEEADVLLLDEPTNDLDIATLEVLEDSLTDFPGAVALVTHDRYLLDRVSTTLVGLDGRGGSAIFADCSQWEREASSGPRGAAARELKPGKVKAEPRKLSFLEKREWEQMEARILEAEQKLKDAESDLAIVEGSGEKQVMEGRYAAFQDAQRQVERLYARWAELEAKVAS